MCTSDLFAWSDMRYCFDFDGTLTNTPMRPDDRKPGYLEATPIPYMIDQVNRLYDEGNYIIISSGGESVNMLKCVDWCEDNNISYGVLTGFKSDNTIRGEASKALWNYHIASESYGVVECVHQIFLHGVV